MPWGLTIRDVIAAAVGAALCFVVITMPITYAGRVEVAELKADLADCNGTIAKKDRAIADSQRLIEAAASRAAEQQVKVVTEYVDRVRVVREKGDTIIQKVPVYVTAEADRNCAVPESFRVLWNAANRGDDAALAGAPGGADEAPSGVVLSGIARQHAVESTYCRAIEQQVIGLQDYVVSLHDAYRGNQNAPH